MSAFTAADARHSGGLTPRLVWEAWRGITRRQIVTTILLGLAMYVYRFVVTIDVMFAPFIVIADQLKAFAVLLAFVVADRLTGKDPDRRGAYALAVFVAAAIVVPLTYFTVWGAIRVFVGSQARPPGGVGFVLNIFFELLMVGGATVWVINDRRRAWRARTRMQVLQLKRIAAERASIESELQAMQARIEPKFLFNTLAQVRRLYEQDPKSGEQLLDALIAHLRAAVPRLRGTSSTVRQELELVRSYLAIARLRTGERLVFTIEAVGARIADARIPAMLLLPLIDYSLSQGLVEWHATGAIRIEASTTQDQITFRILQSGVDAGVVKDDEGIAMLRERLSLLYGTVARLAIEWPQAGQTEAVLDIPRQPAPLPIPELRA